VWKAAGRMSDLSPVRRPRCARFPCMICRRFHFRTSAVETVVITQRQGLVHGILGLLAEANTCHVCPNSFPFQKKWNF